jgi:hypothetical protein
MPYLDSFEYGYLTGFEKLTVIAKEELKLLKANLNTQKTSGKTFEEPASNY